LTTTFKCVKLLVEREEKKMSLDKAIDHRKEHRKQYYGSKAFDCSCRNHGSCDWCKENRLYASTKRMNAIKEQLGELNEYFKD
jgi:hypothetical protein